MPTNLGQSRQPSRDLGGADATGAFGPPVVGGGDATPPRRRSGRRIWLPVAFLLVMVLTAAGTVAASAWFGGSPMRRLRVGGLGVEQAVEAGPSEPALAEVAGVTNFLVVGTDSRAGLTDDDLLRLGTDGEDGTNLTDTLMLVQADAENDTAAVLSFPRDLLVSRCNGSEGRINDAFGVGEETEGSDGPTCLVTTVSRLTGVRIDHFVQVDFQGFIGAVDAVGGVTFHVDEPLEDEFAGLDVPAGCTTFDGERALGFVRARHIDSDFGRIARQQRFLRELLAKAASAETLSSPTRVVELVRVVQDSISTDDGLTTIELARFAWTFRDLAGDRLQTFTVPAVDDEFGDASVLVVQEEQARDLFRRFRSGTVDQPAVVAGAATPSPGAVGSPGAEAPASPAAQGSGTVATSPPAPPETPAAPAPEPSPTFAGASTSDVAC